MWTWGREADQSKHQLPARPASLWSSLSDLRLRETQRMSQQDGLLCMLFMQIIMLNTACENPSTLFKFLSYQLPPYAKLSSAQSKYFNEAKAFIQRQMEEEAANIIPKDSLALSSQWFVWWYYCRFRGLETTLRSWIHHCRNGGRPILEHWRAIWPSSQRYPKDVSARWIAMHIIYADYYA